MRRADGADALHVRAGLDLQLDPPVALRQVAVDLVEQRLGRRGDPDADAALHPGLVRAEARREGRPSARSSASRTAFTSVAFAIGLPRTPANARSTLLDVDVAGAEQRGREEVAQDEPGAVVELLAEVGPRRRRRTRPSPRRRPSPPARGCTLRGDLAEAGPERAHERQLHEEQLDRRGPGSRDAPGTSA